MPGVSRRTALLSVAALSLLSTSACSTGTSSTHVSGTYAEETKYAKMSNPPIKSVPMSAKAGQLLSNVHFPNGRPSIYGKDVAKGADSVILSSGGKLTVSVIESYGMLSNGNLSFNPPSEALLADMQPHRYRGSISEYLNQYVVPTGLTALPVVCLNESASSDSVRKVVSSSQPNSNVSLSLVTDKRSVDLSSLVDDLSVSGMGSATASSPISDVVFIPTSEVGSAHFIVKVDGNTTKISLLGKRL